MTDQNQNPDPAAQPEVEEQKEYVYQQLEGEWEFNPFAVQIMVRHGHRDYPMWVQAANKHDLAALQDRTTEHYGESFRVAARHNPFKVPIGSVIQVKHRGTDGVHLDLDWIKAVAYADPEQDHNDMMPERDLVPSLVNEVKGELRANDGKLKQIDFDKEYF